MLHVVGSVVVFDEAEDVEPDGEVEVEGVDVGVGGGYGAADLGVVHGVFGFDDAPLVAGLDFYDDEHVALLGYDV